MMLFPGFEVLGLEVLGLEQIDDHANLGVGRMSWSES
jgi:hypothetical protein